MSAYMDERIEACVQAAIPELRIALADVFKTQGCHIFNIAQATDSKSGAQIKTVCFICPETLALIFENLITGLELSVKRATEINAQYAKRSQ